MNLFDQSDNTEDLKLIRGKIKRINYVSEETGFTVLEVDSDKFPLGIIITGVGLPTISGLEVLFKGEFQTHPKYGRQFKVNFWEQVKPSDKASIVNFLSSGIFPGIGEKKAELIYQRFGDDSLKIIDATPYRLQEISGIGPKKIQAIKTAYQKHQGQLEIRRYFLDLGLTPNQSQRIIDCYQEKALEIIKQNPYQLIIDLQGFGFARADEIALKSGLAKDNPLRVQAGIIYTLQKAQDDGHCYLNKEQLIQRSQQLLQLNDQNDFEQAMIELQETETIKTDQEKCYLEKNYQQEVQLAELIKIKLAQDLSIKDADKAFDQTIKNLSIELNDKQRESISAALTESLLIITGGPGCGKTTLVNTIVELFSRLKKTIRLAAPTGKAAQRLAEVCGYPASTIHRLLGFDPVKKAFACDITNPIRFKYDDLDDGEDLDLLIVDEFSMVDLQLAYDLISAVSKETKVIIVGDQDQLPSVGPGKVLADLLKFSAIPRIRLDKVYRQDQTSKIIDSAHQVNLGQMPDIPTPDGQTKSDAYFINRKSTDEISKLVVNLYSDQLERKFGFKQSEITILTPTNRGPLGAVELNRQIQQAVNPGDNQAKIGQEDNYLTVNDRVCQRVNNYNIDPDGVFNGDQGVIKDIDPKSGETLIKLWDGRHITYQRKDLNQISLSYAMTIHRSQGSELPCVIVILHDSQFIMLDRQLLYTAMTRAKKLLLIVGSGRALKTACQRARTRLRNTTLTERLQNS